MFSHQIFLARFTAVMFLMNATGVAFAHDPLTESELQELKDGNEYEENLQRAKRMAPHRFGSGLGEAALYKMRKADLKSRGLSDREISRELFGGRMMAFPYAAQPELRSTGNVKTLTVLADFKDFRAASLHPGMAADKFHANIYGGGTSQAQAFHPYESCRNYYQRASENKVNLQGDVLGWYHFPKDRAAYKPASTAGAAENRAIFDMAKEALQSFDANHDFAQYDNDNDGDIDQLTILYAGPKGRWNSFWWAYRWEFFVPEADSVTFDGKRLRQFVFQFISTRGSNRDDFDPQTLIHETGHAFGLADYYDYEAGTGPDGGIGGLDMMDANWGNHNAFSRWLLDWIQPVFVGSGQPVLHTLHGSGAALQDKKAIAIFPGITANAAPGQEMFIIEYRCPEGNDGGFNATPGDGLLIWHVNATPNADDDGFALDNSYTSQKLIRLVRANTAIDFADQDRATANDYFRTGKAFGPPASNQVDGTPTNIVVNAIALNGGGKVDAQVGFEDPPTPVAPAATDDADVVAVAAPVPSDEGRTVRSAAAAPAADDDGQFDLEQLEALFASIQTETPDQLAKRWKSAWAKYGDQLDSRESQVVLQLILTTWASKDGAAAAQAALNLKQAELIEEAFPRVMESWAANDPHAAYQWYFNRDRQQKLNERGLSGGPRFAQTVFAWSAANDPERAVASLEQVDKVPELWGAVASIEKAYRNEGLSSAALKQEIEGLKNSGLVLATQGLKRSVQRINASEEGTDRRSEAYRRYWTQMEALDSQIPNDVQVAELKSFVELKLPVSEAAAPAAGATPP